MSAEDQKDDRVWARTDRTMAPPQRAYARRMRRTPTDAEGKLWWHLRHRLLLHGSHFRRQVQIGPYIADFLCHRSMLIVEIDVGQHGSQTANDDARTRRLEAEGYRVLRFWNNDVLMNIDGVLTEILNASATTPPPTPPHKGEGRRESADPPPPGEGEGRKVQL